MYKNKPATTFAATLSYEMRRRNMSVEEFAIFLDIGKTSLQDHLKGEGNPTLHTMELIADKLGIPVYQMLWHGPVQPYGRAALNGVRDEIMQLHPDVRNIAYQQFLSLQSTYDLSDIMSAREEVNVILTQT